MDRKPTYDELEQIIIKLENEIAVLKEAKKRLQIFASAIDDSTEGIAIIDRDGNLKYLNKTFAELHGYSADDLLGKHFSIFHTPEQMPSVEEANRQLKEKGNFIGEIWHARCDGTIFPTTMHNSLVRDEEGRPVYFLGTLRDISEQKKLERELLESRNKYKSLFEGSLSPIIVFDRNGIVLMINTVGAGNLGLSVDACIGKSITELLPDQGEIFLPVFQKVMDNRMRMTREDLIKLPSDSRWFWSILEPVSNIQGKVYGVQVISYDITKQKKAENEIQESKQRLTDFINSATDSFVLFDSELNILEMNKAHMEMFHPGMDQQDIIGKNLAEIVPNLRETGRYDDFMKVMKTGIPFHVDNIIPHPKFGKRNLSVKAFKMAGGLGTITVDVTARVQVEMELKKAKEKLEEQVKERTIELEEKNTTLKVLLGQRNEDKKQFEKVIMSNVKELLIPHLTRLKDSDLNSRQQMELNILESNLNEIISPLASSLTSSYLKFTATEIQVANFIKHGATSKQIALSLGLSRRTIDTHRYNIRKKMGLSGKGVNLKTYLSSQ